MEANLENPTDLDYQIEYPSNDNDNNADIGKSDSSQRRGANLKNIWPIAGFENENEKKIVVVLFGWVGSQHKYLAKYSDIYLQRGCIVIRCIVSPKILFIQTEKLSGLAHSIVQLFKKLELESHPVFFHSFSNGGSFVLSYVLRELSAVQKNMKLDLRGTIFDSAPCPRSVWNGFKAVSNLFPTSPFRYLLGFFAIIWMLIQIFWSQFKTGWMMFLYGEPLPMPLLDTNSMRECVDDSPVKNWLGRLCKMRNHSYLFLYSDADELFPWKTVEKVADITASYSNSVEKKKFIGSKHVEHYRKYPEEYVQAVVSFIQENMKTKRKDPIVFWEDY